MSSWPRSDTNYSNLKDVRLQKFSVLRRHLSDLFFASNFVWAVKFLKVLSSRQINRLECMALNDDYMSHHFWDTELHEKLVWLGC